MAEKIVRLRAKFGDKTFAYDLTSVTWDEWQEMLSGLDSLSEKLAEVVRQGKLSGDESIWIQAQRDKGAVTCAASILRRIGQLVERTKPYM